MKDLAQMCVDAHDADGTQYGCFQLDLSRFLWTATHVYQIKCPLNKELHYRC